MNDSHKLMGSIRILQVMMAAFLVLVVALLIWVSQLGDQVEAVTRRVEALNRNFTGTLMAGQPELKRARAELQELRDLARQLNEDLAQGGRFSRQIRKETDRAVDQFKRELPSVMDTIIDRKLRELEQRARSIQP